MTYTVTFLGTSSLPVTSSGGAYRIWSYKVEGSNTEIVTGRRMTMAFPGSVTVVDPSAYPGVDALSGTLVWRSPEGTRQYVAARAGAPGSVVIAFVAAAQTSSGQVQLFKATPGNELVEVQYQAVPDGGDAGHSQRLVVPAVGAPAFTGRPLYDFAGALPYDSELFGVYQPLSGWVGATAGMSAVPINPSSDIGNLTRPNFHGSDALTLVQPGLRALADRYSASAGGALSPVGLVNLFREYFFEFDNFLGTPSGHIWVSPGGTVEVVESSTRRTLVEKVVEQSEEVSRKSEESLTDQTDVSDAVKEENSNDTKLGVSATGGVNAKIYHADASLSFSTQNTVKRGAEATHKRARTQTSKVTSEIKRNFKTTFRTVTETTDTSSRRYVLQNTTSELVNYEMRRKMRKVGIQLQHVGTRLCWQIHLMDPGRELGLGDMVHVVPAPDLSAIQKPEKIPEPESKEVPYHFEISFQHEQGPDDEAEETYLPEPGNDCRGLNDTPDYLPGKDDIIQFCFPKPLPPVPEGYTFSKVHSLDKHGAQVEFAPFTVNTSSNPHTLNVKMTYANFQGRKSLPFDVTLVYEPTEEAKNKVRALNDAAQAEYQKEVDRLQHEAYGQAVRERLRLISSMRLRSSDDLRNEERRCVFRKLINQLPKGIYPTPNNNTPYLEAEEIQKFFDVDEMLYFVSPDFWRAGAVTAPTPDAQTTGRYPVRPIPKPAPGSTLLPLAGQTVAGWYSGADFYALPNSTSPSPPYEWRVNYLISEETVPAPLGSSLGWLIQIDADERRNEFLNAAWAKVVVPVRPGQEQAALAWLKKVEGEAGLGKTYTRQTDDPDDYQGKTVGQVLDLLATHLRSLAQEKFDTTLAADKVFENGFDPLAGGFRPAEPYRIFDQWVEVLPTDQVVAVSVKYDPKTGQQL
ncbi:hypothetical protein ACFYYR_25820 [Streptomyces sp. NPDC001922]|uniref:hypothetical protein n=1 Tax=Streptomyces sp. NPDC001922 TaxID=3364624 RepID=UPI0036A74B16